MRRIAQRRADLARLVRAVTPATTAAAPATRRNGPAATDQ